MNNEQNDFASKVASSLAMKIARVEANNSALEVQRDSLAAQVKSLTEELAKAKGVDDDDSTAVSAGSGEPDKQ